MNTDLSPILIIIILVILMVVLWWALTRQAQTNETPAAHHEAEVHIKPVEVVAPEPTRAPAEMELPAVNPQVDDLEIIEGIGPKIAGLLKESGIRTFAQLSTATQDQLRELLLRANLRVNDPSSWPDQARLAAEGQWEALKAMQDSLKGGRKV